MLLICPMLAWLNGLGQCCALVCSGIVHPKFNITGQGLNLQANGRLSIDLNDMIQITRYHTFAGEKGECRLTPLLPLELPDFF